MAATLDPADPRRHGIRQGRETGLGVLGRGPLSRQGAKLAKSFYTARALRY